MCACENIVREFFLIFPLFLNSRQFPSSFHQPVFPTADVRATKTTLGRIRSRAMYLLPLRVFSGEFPRVRSIKFTRVWQTRNSRYNRDPMSETCSNTSFLLRFRCSKFLTTMWTVLDSLVASVCKRIVLVTEIQVREIFNRKRFYAIIVASFAKLASSVNGTSF